MDEVKTHNEILTCINQDFDDFQETLSKREKKLKFYTTIHVNDDFYGLISDISGRKELKNKK